VHDADGLDVTQLTRPARMLSDRRLFTRSRRFRRAWPVP
jgi:hypothetical protein